MTAHEEPPRWRYRFGNFSRAYSLLREAAELWELLAREDKAT